MKIIFAYISVILIWATTPLAIHWSNTDFDFNSSICGRIVIAAALGLVALKISGMQLVKQPKDWLNFAVGSLGLFPTMLLVYWAAKSVPSGVMSVIFGLFPFFVGVFSVWLLKLKVFTPLKFAALCLALAGLALINFEQLQVGWDGMLGIVAIVVATLFWASSSVLLKSMPTMEPFRQSVGSMVFAAPGFIIIWLIFADPLPPMVGIRSLAGMTYLVVAGSLLGHTLFFYVLRQCSVATVSLIPLITPTLALILGWFIEGEILGVASLVGAITVIVSLGIFQGFAGSLMRIIKINAGRA